MKKIMTCLNVAVAALALWISVPGALAGQPGMHARNFSLNVSPDAKTDAITMGMLSMGTYPPADGEGNDYWPCFTGGSDADCSSIPAGALVIGIPYQDWNISACTSGVCGQIYLSFTSNHETGDVMVSETITQGSSTVYQSGTTNLGPGTAPFMSIVWDDIAMGPIACSGCVDPVKGPATIKATVTINSVTVSRSASIIMQE